jgi:hypothetical protein
LEEAPEKYAATTEQLTKLVGESVALVVALCDALAWIGDSTAIKELRSAMELRHRRIQVEAAAALARLGEADGLDHLVELAAQPLVRTRVLHYLDELDEIERVPEEHRTALARAAGELSAWLAEPTRFGIPPTLIELVDERQMYWPGFDEPQDCFLFRYEFRVGEHMLAGVALAGPVVHALMVDLQDLPPIEIYAAYAGWYAEHPEIRERGIDEMSPVDLVRWQQASSALENAGYEDLVLVKIGRFFHQEHFVATARREGRPGVVVFDREEIYWQPTAATRRPLGPTEVYYIRKGRALLQAFNQAE